MLQKRLHTKLRYHPFPFPLAASPARAVMMRGVGHISGNGECI